MCSSTIVLFSFSFLRANVLSPPYGQRKISFDAVYAWEKTLLEPVDYWSRVPPLWKPYWHFQNIPISGDPVHPDSPVRLLKTIGLSRTLYILFLLIYDCHDLRGLHFMSTFASLLLSIYESSFAFDCSLLVPTRRISIYLSLTLTPLSVICPASPLDFVSFKLDVDHPETELPIALGLLNDPRLSSIVDEFFFEFHFRSV